MRRCCDPVTSGSGGKSRGPGRRAPRAAEAARVSHVQSAVWDEPDQARRAVPQVQNAQEDPGCVRPPRTRGGGRGAGAVQVAAVLAWRLRLPVLRILHAQHRGPRRADGQGGRAPLRGLRGSLTRCPQVLKERNWVCYICTGRCTCAQCSRVKSLAGDPFSSLVVKVRTCARTLERAHALTRPCALRTASSASPAGSPSRPRPCTRTALR